MRSKKLLPAVVLIAAILAMVAYSLVTSIAKKPVITEKEFPFSVTYEMDGETVTIEDVCSVRYDRNGGYTDTKTRFYVGMIDGIQEENVTVYVLKEEPGCRILLDTKLYGDYLMGDPRYDYFSHDTFEPQILYYDADEMEYTDEETLLEQGVKLVGWEYPEPVENSFVFSHISIFSSAVVVPTMLIGLAALLIIAVFAKKEKDLVRKPVDIVSTVLNYIITIVLVPFFAVIASLLDITGDNDDIFQQVFYFTSAMTALGVAASVWARRRGAGKTALAVQLVVPAVFGAIIALLLIFS